MMDLETMANPYSPADAAKMYTSYFDSSLSRSRNAVPVTATPFFTPPPRRDGGYNRNPVRNPNPYNSYPNLNPRPGVPYQSSTRYNPRLPYGYTPYPVRYNPRPSGFQNLPPSPLYNQGNPFYRGGYPGFPGQGNPYGYYPPRRNPTWGDKFVNFLNDVEATVNNVRAAVADVIGPKYPYVTRYLDSPYGDQRIPVYRNRSQTYDMPGYAMPAAYSHYAQIGFGYPGDYRGNESRAQRANGGIAQNVPGYQYTSPPYRPGYGYSAGFGYFPLKDDGGRRAMQGLTGYRYVPYQGYVKDPGYSGGPAFVPQRPAKS